MGDKGQWVLTFTPPDAAGREVGRYASRDDSMFAAQEHFDRLTGLKNLDDQEELGWQMSFVSATALSEVGIYRVVRADARAR